MYNSSEVLFIQTELSSKMSTILTESEFLLGFAQSEKVITVARVPRHQGRSRVQDGMITVFAYGRMEHP